ncbi:MAG: lysophospholipid acyltransferase family protein [Brevinematia bacterium]
MVFFKVVFTLLVFVIVVPFTVILGVSGIVLSMFSKNLAHYCEKIYFNIILFLTFTRVRVTGIENIEKGKNYLVISNHQSAFDIIVLSAKLPLQIRWVSKESVFKIPIIGQFMDAMGYIHLPRENPKKSVEIMKKYAVSVNGSPTMFPEGTRSSDGKLQRFKRGFILVARSTGLDLLPIVLKGTIRIMKKGSLIVNPFVQVEVIVLPPIDNTKVVNNEDIVDEIMELYKKYLDV